MHTIKLIIFMSVLAAMVGTAGAAVIAADDFNSYSVGALDSQGAAGSGWGGAWTASDGANTGDVSVVNYGLSYNAGGISINGGTRAVELIDSSGSHQRLRRALAGDEGTGGSGGDDYYFSFLVNWKAGVIGNGDAATHMVDGYYSGNGSRSDDAMVGMYGATSFDPDRAISADMHQGSGADQVYWPTEVTLDTTYLIVARYWKDPNGAYFDGSVYNKYDKFNRLDVWVNPDTSDNAGTYDLTSQWALTSIPKGDSFDAIILMAWSGLDAGDIVAMDEYTMATTWGDVIPEPATMSMLAFGGLALLRRKK